MLVVCHRLPATAQACAAAAQAGATVFEVDVRLVDGELRVSHHLPVRGAGWLERDGASVRRTGSVVDERLLASLDRVPAGCAVLLDLKDDRGPSALRLAESVRAAGLPESRVMASSKHSGSLALLHEAGVRTWLSLATRSRLRGHLTGPPSPGGAVTVRHRLLTPPVVDALHERGERVGAWTVNDPERARTLARVGVDAVTSDRLAVFRVVGQPAADP